MEERRRWATAWVVSKSMMHINDKHIFFGCKKLLCCASWPVMHEKCSHAWPALVFHAGRAENASSWCCSKPECLIQTRTLGKTKPREYRSSLLLQTWSGKERQRGREWVVPWRHKSSRREHRQTGPKEPLARSPAQWCTGRQKIPRDWDDFTHKHYFRWCLLNLDKYFKNVPNLTSSLFSFF